MTPFCQARSAACVVLLIVSLFEAASSQIRMSPAISAADVERLVDPIFAEQLSKLNIPGAAISVVSNGKLVFSKGYGVADLEKKTPVVADKTVFRIGSITKVFTALAVMQLLDQGKIKLTDDVNRYLKGVRVPDTMPQPVTFAHLLTHTSGFDEISPGRRTSIEAEVVPLGEFLKGRIVRQFAPGEIISYSTYNPALAALAVEQITSTPFKTYLAQNVFEPLKMERTSISALKPQFRPDLASGYEYGDGKHQKLPFQWFHTYPASDINSTVTDMARFMIAHLDGGQLEGKRILSERSTREMQTSQFRNHPDVPGWSYGFYENVRNGYPYIEHGGSMDDGYSALMTMVPSKKLGIFIACNTEGGAAQISGALKAAIFDKFLPWEKPFEPAPTYSQTREQVAKFAGKYKPIIYCHTCAPGTTYNPDPHEVTVNADGTLTLNGDKWRQVGPLLFVLAEGRRAGQVQLGFKLNSKGEIAYMFNQAFFVWERVQ